ncbi:MAG TPA: methylenetetrahydrofolate reductase [Steroidobacteraceae bacterium]
MATLAEKIRARQFVITAELVPPKGIDLSELYQKALDLKPYVDAINVTESPRARMAVAPIAVARGLIERGVEPIVQTTARDRNRLAFQADLLGAATLGIRNFVFMTGDEPGHGDHPDAKPVHDLSTVEMLRAARMLSEGRDLAGNELKGSPSLFAGATANPAASDFSREVAATHAKIEAGARFLQTQALYEPEALARFLEAVELGEVALLAGVLPLKSARMALWLNENVPGIRVPERLIRELEAASGDPEAERQLGIDIAARIIRQIRPYCSGIHLMAMGLERSIPEILERSALVHRGLVDRPA